MAGARNAGGVSFANFGPTMAPAGVRAVAGAVLPRLAAAKGFAAIGATMAGPVGWAAVAGFTIWSAAHAVGQSKAAFEKALLDGIDAAILSGDDAILKACLALCDQRCDAALVAAG